MNIDDLTIGQAKQLAALFTSASPEATFTPHIGRYVIVRCYASGVHAGTLVAQSGRQVELSNARRLWRWDVAPEGISLSDLSLYGTIGDRSRVCATTPSITLLDALEIIPCSEVAAENISSAEVTKP